MGEFLVLKLDFRRGRGAWQEIDRVEAGDAGAAFHAVVAPPTVEPPRSPTGEYLVLSLEGSAHLGVELTLRDLSAPDDRPPTRERWTEDAKRVTEVALREALSSGKNYIGVEHLRAALDRLSGDDRG